MKTTQEEKRARLMIFSMPDTMKRKRYEIAFWLRGIAKEIETEDPKNYTKNPRWTLYR